MEVQKVTRGDFFEQKESHCVYQVLTLANELAINPEWKVQVVFIDHDNPHRVWSRPLDEFCDKMQFIKPGFLSIETHPF